MNIEQIRAKLVSALTQYDTKEEARETKRGLRVNIYRLGILLSRVDSAMDQHLGGDSLARALYDNFNDRLLTSLEKAFALPVTFGGGAHDTGRPA